MFLLLEQEKLIGFLYSVSYKKENFLLYLAILSSKRKQGYGSYFLQWYCSKKKEESIYLNIEEVNPSFSDYDIRNKRYQFYLKNFFHDTNYIGIEGNQRYHIFAFKKHFPLKKYKEIDKKIAHLFFCKKAVFVKRQ